MVEIREPALPEGRPAGPVALVFRAILDPAGATAPDRS
jgi:hypothetical protein